MTQRHTPVSAPSRIPLATGLLASIFLSLLQGITLPQFAVASNFGPVGLDPTAFGLSSSAREVMMKRTERAATFELSPGKYATVSGGEELFTPDASGTMVPVEKKGKRHGDQFVFDKLPGRVHLVFDLMHPRYVLEQDGFSFAVAYLTPARGVVENDTTVAYVLAPGVTLRWQVKGNQVEKTITVEKPGPLPDLSFGITPSDNLTQTLSGSSIALADVATDDIVFMTRNPFLTDAEGTTLPTPVALRRVSTGTYDYLFDPTNLPYPYIIDPTSGPRDPGTLANDTTVGTVLWNSEEEAATSDDSYTTAFLYDNEISYYLKATNFGFSVGNGAVIDGIVMEVERTGATICDFSVRIVQGGTIQGDNKANCDGWPVTDEYDSYGGSGDLWGLAWTTANINATDFGVAISAENLGAEITVAEIDHIRMTVYYTGGDGVGSFWNPTLLVSTEAFLLIEDLDTAADVVLRFGDVINKTLTYERTLTRFKFDDDVYITNTLGVAGVASGAVVRGQKTLASSGTLTWEGQGSGAGLYLGGTFEGVGLTDCDTDVQALSWDATNKRFVCGDDDTGGAGTPEVGTSSFTGAVRTVGDAKYVLNQGDTMTGSLTLAGSGNLLLAQTATSGSIVRTATTVDSASLLGAGTSIAIGTNGLPIVSYRDITTSKLKIVACGNAACTSGNTITSPSETNGVYSSIAIPPDGLPIISFDTAADIKIFKCGNASCTSGNTSAVIDDSDASGQATSIAIGADGLPIISYRDNTNTSLEIVKCGDASCSSGNVTTSVEDVANNVGAFSSITIGADGLPIISYYDASAGDLHIAKCGDAACVNGNVITNVDSASNVGRFTSTAIGADGLPVVSYNDFTTGDLKVLKCSNASCSGNGNIQTIVDSTNNVGSGTTMGIPADGLPFIAYFDTTAGDLKVVKCGRPDCSTGNTITTVDSTGIVGEWPSVAIGPDDLPVISYRDAGNGDLKVLRCADPTCSKTSASAFTNGRTLGSFRGNNRSFSPGFEFLNANNVGGTTSFRSLNFFTNGVSRMTITGAGKVGIGTTNPDTALEVAGTSSGSITIGGTISGAVVIAQAFSGAGLSNCVGGNKLLWTQATGRFSCTADETGSAGIVDHYVLASGDTMTGSLTLSGSGHLLNALAATSGSVALTALALDTSGDVGEFTSVAVGTDGMPIISYYDRTNTALKVIKCGNLSCGGDNVTTTVDNSSNVGSHSSIAIGSDGLPVISYYDATSTALKVAKCGHDDCRGGAGSGNVITIVENTAVDGQFSSIAILPDGLPIVLFYSGNTPTLKTMKCGNLSCSSGNVTTSVISMGLDLMTSRGIAFVIAPDGLPFIAYNTSTGNASLVALKCGNSICSAGNTTKTLTSSVGGYETSVMIGSDGLPIISYQSQSTSDLSVTKCENAACTVFASFAVEFSGTTGVSTSMALGPDGLPLIAYYDVTNTALKLAKCGNASCTVGNTLTTVESTNVVGTGSSLAIGSDGLPVISFYDFTNGNLRFIRCADTTCSKASASAYTGGTRIGAPKGNESSYVPAFEDVSVVSIGNPSGFRNLSFFSNGVERMTITPSGFIGINTAAPREALEVAGNILIGAQPDTQKHRFEADCLCLTNSTGGLFGSLSGVNGLFSMATFNGKVYAGTQEGDNAGVYRYDGGTTWTLVSDSTPGKIISGDTDNVDLVKLTVYNGKLYAGTWTAGNTGAVYAYDGTTWAMVNATAGTFGAEASRDGVADMHVYNGQLYIATQEANAAGIYRYDGGSTFTLISFSTLGRMVTGDATDMDAAVLISYGGRLWVGVTTGSTTGRVFAYDGNAGVWTLINTTRGTFAAGTTLEPDIVSMIVYNGQLFIGTSRGNLANIYLYKGGMPPAAGADVFIKTTTTSGRIDATNDATDIDGVWAMQVYNGRLYAGSYVAAGSTGALYEYTGPGGGSTNGWTIVNATRGTFGKQIAIESVFAMVELNGTLYVGTYAVTNNGGVYTFNKTSDNSYGLRFASTGSNFATMSFGGDFQAQNNFNHQGSFLFTHPLASTTGAFDYAEDYPTSDPSLVGGEIAAIEGTTEAHVRRAVTGSVVIGIVSGRPGFRLQPTAEQKANDAYVPIALMGRVPVNVSTENGPIKAGDHLTLSSIPGVAMKATRAAIAIGRALTSFTGPGIGRVTTFVDVGWFEGE